MSLMLPRGSLAGICNAEKFLCTPCTLEFVLEFKRIVNYLLENDKYADGSDYFETLWKD